MICNIVACGPSGKYWDGNGYSIGVNDCRKWGYEVDVLLVVNSLDKYPDRKKIVADSSPREKLLALGMWCSHPKYERIPFMHPFRGTLEKGNLYKSTTSPFIAVTLAYSLGYNMIVLWGVDFDNHPVVKGHRLNSEVEMYGKLQIALRKDGCSMYLGCMDEYENEGALSGIIPNFRWVSAQ